MTSPQHFSSCALKPLTGDQSSSSSIKQSSEGEWKTSAFYLDSSGRSSIALPLQLTFPSKEVIDEFLASSCITPMPSNLAENEEKSPDENEEKKDPSRFSFRIEAKVTLTVGSGEAISALVEEVNIVSSRVDGNSICFETEINLRVSRAHCEKMDSSEASRVRTNLDITAVLTEKLANFDRFLAASSDLRALNAGGFPDFGSTPSHRRFRQTKLNPFTLLVALTHAFSISARSVAGPSMGQTLISLSIRHSNTHSEDVKITNIALHPGHSRIDEFRDGQPLVADMSKSIQWGYAPQCDPHLPLVIGPQEAYSTVVQVYATEDIRCRCMCSPMSVTAVVGKEGQSKHRIHVIAASDVHWSSSRAAIEPADAFRVEMSLEETEFSVGAAMTVFMDITNLSPNWRQLNLVVSGDEEDGMRLDEISESSNSSKEGQTLAITGLSTEGRHEKLASCHKEELLAVDNILSLGTINGRATTTARLRFIPLREGVLPIPNLKLIDKKTGKTYQCIHRLKIVAGDRRGCMNE